MNGYRHISPLSMSSSPRLTWHSLSVPLLHRNLHASRHRPSNFVSALESEPRKHKSNLKPFTPPSLPLNTLIGSSINPPRALRSGPPSHNSNTTILPSTSVITACPRSLAFALMLQTANVCSCEGKKSSLYSSVTLRAGRGIRCSTTVTSIAAAHAMWIGLPRTGARLLVILVILVFLVRVELGLLVLLELLALLVLVVLPVLPAL